MARTREPARRDRSVDRPIRTCVGCRSRGTVPELVRVVARDGAVAPDPRRREPGRGAWLHPDATCLRRAERRSAFPRALRVPGPLDTDALHALLADDGADGRGDPATAGSGTRKQVDPDEPAVKHSR